MRRTIVSQHTVDIAAELLRFGKKYGLEDAAVDAAMMHDFMAAEKALQYLLKTGAISHRLFTNALCAMMGV